MFIDTHAHLYLHQFEDDLEQVIARARKSGVGRILLPNVDLNTIGPMHQLEEGYPDLCIAMMGLHPCSVGVDFEKELREIEKWLSKRSYLAIGEIGIDLYWDKKHLSNQLEAFRIQTTWAHDRDLPIVIHSRESLEEILVVLEDMALPGLKGVFHCFTGDLVQVQRVIDLGFLMGIGGVLTFKNSGLDKIISEVDLSQLILETDAPYLTPHPYRGKRNESAHVRIVAEKLAEVTGTSVEEVARITSANAMELFKL